MEKELLAILSAILGVSEDQVKAKAETEDGRKELLTSNSAKISEVKQTAFNDGEKKARKTQREAYEAEIKAAFDLESDKQGVDLVKELTDKIRTELKEATNDIKTHPDYLALERENAKKIKALEAEAANKIKEVETGYQRKETLRDVTKRALAEFEALNPVLATDPAKAAKQKALIIREIEAGNYQIDGESVLILDKDGKRREDDQSNPIKFTDFVKETADNLGFEFKAATDRKSGGDDNPAGGGTTEGYKGELPKTKDQLYERLQDRSIPIADRQAMQQAFEATQK